MFDWQERRQNYKEMMLFIAQVSKALHAFDSVYFHSFHFDKLFPDYDMSLSEQELAQKHLDYHLEHSQKSYIRFNGEKLTPESFNSFYTFSFTVRSPKRVRSAELTFSIGKGNEIKGLTLMNRINIQIEKPKSFEWLKGIKDVLMEVSNASSSFCTNQFFYHKYTKYDEANDKPSIYAFGYTVGAWTYISESLDKINDDELPAGVIVEKYRDGKILYCTNKEIFNPDNPEHTKVALELALYFVKNKMGPGLDFRRDGNRSFP